MKKLSEQLIDDLLKLKFGQMVTEPGHCAFATNKTLGKIFKISAFKVADIIRVRFERNRL